MEIVVEGSPQILLEDTVDLIGTKTGGHEGILAVAVLVKGRLDVADEHLVLLRAGEGLVDAVGQVLVGLEALEDGADSQTGGKGGAEDKIEALKSAGVHVAKSPAHLGSAMLDAMAR